MSNLQDLPAPEPRLDIVEMLEELIEQVKSGDVRGVCVASTTGDGSTSNRIMCDEWPVLMLGSVQVLERELEDMYLKLRCHEPGGMY